MSWAEVFKINSNMRKTLNEQLRDIQYRPIRIIDASTTFAPEKTGIYKVICVGKGGDGKSFLHSNTLSRNYAQSGGAGGVAIKTVRLFSSETYNVDVGTAASFECNGTLITATAGENGSGNEGASYAKGGTASGGDYNFDGGKGTYASHSTSEKKAKGGDVGVMIAEFYQPNDNEHGGGVIRYGGGGSSTLVYDIEDNSYSATKHSGSPAAVIIICLEAEE